MAFVVDEERALLTYCTYSQAWEYKEKRFRFLTQPEVEHFPRDLKDERLIGLLMFFWSTLNRYGMPSRKTMGDAITLFIENQWLIDPLIFDESKDYGILSPILPYSGKKQLERIAGWKENLVTLRDRYNGDAREIFLQSEPDHDLLAKPLEKQFKGVGEKVSDLMILWFQDYPWKDNQEKWEKIRQVPAVPVDIHVMRLHRTHGILKEWDSDSHHYLVPRIRKTLIRICETHKLKHSFLSQGLWHGGADICRFCPRDLASMRAMQYCLCNCPGHDLCKGLLKPPSNYFKKTGKVGYDYLVPRQRNLFYL